MTKKERQEKLFGDTTKILTGCGNLYVTLNIDADGNPFQCLTQMAKAGGCAASQCEAIGRMISLILRTGTGTLEDIIKELNNIHCNVPKNNVLSCADGIAQILNKHIPEKK